MKAITLLIFFNIAMLLIACERKNSVYNDKIGKIKKVVILGNSIVARPANPAVGWYGNWGMAASNRDSDFVHRLISDIHKKNSAVTVKFRNIANFEHNYRNYNYHQLDSLVNPDLLIIRISENVNGKTALDSGFIQHYDQLINFIDPRDKAVKVIVDGFFQKGYRAHHLWKKNDVNDMEKQYALKKEYPFIENSQLSNDVTNTAAGTFRNKEVAIHPSDKGMKAIEESIWQYISVYFN